MFLLFIAERKNIEEMQLKQPHTCFIFFVPWHLVGRVPLNHTALDGWWVSLPDNLSLRIDPQNWLSDDKQLSDCLEKVRDFSEWTRYLQGEALVLTFYFITLKCHTLLRKILMHNTYFIDNNRFFAHNFAQKCTTQKVWHKILMCN